MHIYSTWLHKNPIDHRLQQLNHFPTPSDRSTFKLHQKIRSAGAPPTEVSLALRRLSLLTTCRPALRIVVFGLPALGTTTSTRTQSSFTHSSWQLNFDLSSSGKTWEWLTSGMTSKTKERSLLSEKGRKNHCNSLKNWVKEFLYKSLH